ncbi:LptF/LptG family permease, partial [Candidatus Latescibacterota bacterium]
MRKLSKYILKEFLSFLMYGIIAFAVIFILVDLVDNLDNFIDNKVRISLIVLYYIFNLPFIIVLTFPVAMLLSTMFSLGRLSSDNELTAMKASGVSF